MGAPTSGTGRDLRSLGRASRAAAIAFVGYPTAVLIDQELREYAVSIGSCRGFKRHHHAFMYFDHMTDPVITDPSLYSVVWENDRVRILEYLDAPGDATHVYSHPDSVMVTLLPSSA
jgi:hypothetical protein